METNCAPLVADLLIFCYERDFMESLSRENQDDIIEAFNFTSRYSYDMEVVTKEWSISEKNSRLSWDSNPDCPDKNPML